MSSEEQASSSSSSSDEEPIDEEDDKFFFKALSCLKNKDPRIYDSKVVFFPEDVKVKEEAQQEENATKTKKNKTEKGLFLRDYERDMVVKTMKGDGVDEEENACTPEDDELPYVVQQKSLKESFKAALNEPDSEEEEGPLLKVKKKTQADAEKEEDEYKAWLKGNKEELSDKETERELKPLKDFWSEPGLDPNEQFLKDYILNKRYLEAGEEDVDDDGVSEDGELLEMQEKFETDYNLRFENDANTEIKRYPRVIEGSLRRKDESRKKKRRERVKRKRLEKEQKKEDISKIQKQKLLEFKEQVDKIKKLTGNDQLGFKDEEIFGDDEFDPEAHDRKMQELYGDAFYSAGADDVDKPDFNEEFDENELLEYGDPDNMDVEANLPTCSKETTRSKKKRKEKKKAVNDILDVVKPEYDPQVHSSYQKYIDEYYEMECEDFIDDIPCRFKYKQVVPNDYGLTIEEILTADDKELNQWVSAKKIAKLKPEHVELNEVKIYKRKGQDFALKKKILASIYGSPKREEEDNDDGADDTTEVTPPPASSSEGKSKKRKADKKDVPQEQAASKKQKSSIQRNEASPTQNSNKVQSKTQNKPHGPMKKKFGKFNKNRKGGNKWKDPIENLSDTRLKAYNIKPKEFKKKMKFKK